MDRKELDMAWFEAHPISAFIFAACIAFAAAYIYADLRLLAAGNTPNLDTYIGVLAIATGFTAAGMLRRRAKRKKAEQATVPC